MRHLFTRRRFLAAATSGLTAATMLGSAAHAGAFPEKPVKLVVPFIAGSPVDALARVAMKTVAERLGQPVIIENQAGAGGGIGARTVARAAPDGYTLLFALNSHAYGLYANPGFDPVADFTPIATIAQWSHVLIVRPDFPANSLESLIAHARKHPGEVTFGFGSNTPPQILGETLKIVTGVDIRSVPYRGGAQAVQDLLGGRIDMNFGATSTLLPLIESGKARAIAYTGAKRARDLPDVPTVAEAGFPRLAFDPDAWAGVLGPKSMSKDIVIAINRAVVASLVTPESRAALMKLGYEPRSMSPEEFETFLASEMKRWPPIVKAAGLAAE